MRTLLLTAMASGAGKTVTACALLAALKKRGVKLRSFKCGPDYIDPMFHERVLGVPCRNLDLFLMGEEGVKRALTRAGAELALIEGAMGYYDGVGGTDEASAFALARLTKTPAVLTVAPGGSALTLAAQIRGVRDFRPDSGVAALLLANCPEKRAASLTAMLERETGLPVLGFLPPMEEGRFDSRHLGLKTAAEIEDLAARLIRLGEAAERHIDLDRLLALCGAWETKPDAAPLPPARCRIAVARDAAFCFTYADSLDALERAGAKLVFFSPLRDPGLPEADGLYLPGGYPELYAAALAENASMRESVAAAVGRGLPTAAECGGFLYLLDTLEDAAGQPRPMCAVLPGRGYRTARLRRFGYLTLTAEEDSLLFRAGERVPAHEFHYWDATETGAALTASKADGRTWRCGHASESLYAAFPHLHFGGETPLAARFVRACEAWKRSKR